MLAMVGCGEYKSVGEAAERLVRVKETIYPDSARAQKYAERYAVYKKLYPALKDLR